MNKLKALALGMTLSSALFAGQAIAAGDGSLGSDSEASSVVSLTIANVIKITGVEDITFSSYSGTGELKDESEYCVFVPGSGDYAITVTNTSIPGDGFKLSSASGKIAFEVKVDDTLTASTSGESLTHANSSSLTMGGDSSAACSTKSHSLAVIFTETNLQALTDDTYTATLLLTVGPT